MAARSAPYLWIKGDPPHGQARHRTVLGKSSPASSRNPVPLARRRRPRSAHVRPSCGWRVLCRHLARIASLSAQFNETIAAVPAVRRRHRRCMSVPGSSRGKVNVEFGAAIRSMSKSLSWRVNYSRSWGTLRALSGQRRDKALSLAARRASSAPAAGTDRPSLFLALCPTTHLSRENHPRRVRSLPSHRVETLTGLPHWRAHRRQPLKSKRS